MIDLHSHILPDLDDGASDWEQSLVLARVAVEDGIKGLVCTPHWVPGKYENTRSIVLERFAEFRKKLKENSIPLDVYPGAELRIDISLTRRILAGELLTINDGGSYALIELPDEGLPDNLEDYFWQIQLKGIKPIIGHVERNSTLRHDPERLYRWSESGILCQITASSILGEFGAEVREFSVRLLEHRMAHMVVTDSHGLRVRAPKLSGAFQVIEELLGREIAEEMTRGIPERIINGESFIPAEPLPLKKPGKKSFLGKFFAYSR
jgi:protein-tyrosine phosphatase